MGHDSAKHAGSLLGGTTSRQFHFADFTLDQSRYRLQQGQRILRLEKRPMELLILLIERRGDLVSRGEIGQRLWGKDVFLDVDRSINTAVSKVRVALRDDPDKPRFVETVVGKGYRFSAPVVCGDGDNPVPIAIPAEKPCFTEEPHPKKNSLHWRRLLVGATALAVIGVALLNRRQGSLKTSHPPIIKSIAVLPLKNLSGDSSQEYLADGLTEALVGRLSLVRGLRVSLAPR
jgi:DNA-binding winged helix-turn-helix (wHTH) protein